MSILLEAPTRTRARLDDTSDPDAGDPMGLASLADLSEDLRESQATVVASDLGDDPFSSLVDLSESSNEDVTRIANNPTGEFDGLVLPDFSSDLGDEATFAAPIDTALYAALTEAESAPSPTGASGSVVAVDDIRADSSAWQELTLSVLGDDPNEAKTEPGVRAPAPGARVFRKVRGFTPPPMPKAHAAEVEEELDADIETMEPTVEAKPGDVVAAPITAPATKPKNRPILIAAMVSFCIILSFAPIALFPSLATMGVTAVMLLLVAGGSWVAAARASKRKSART